MTVRLESTGERLHCDGCGRLDAGPGRELVFSEHTVNDPNTSSATKLHFCANCSQNRNLHRDPIQTIQGWNAANPPEVGPGETREQHEAAMRGEQVAEVQGGAEEHGSRRR